VRANIAIYSNSELRYSQKLILYCQPAHSATTVIVCRPGMPSDGWQEAWRPPQGSHKMLVVRDNGLKNGRHQVSLGWKSQWNLILSPFSLWHCCLGDRKGIWPVESWVLLCWWSRFHCSFACHSSSCHHHVHYPCSSRIQNDGILLPADPCRLENGCWTSVIVADVVIVCLHVIFFFPFHVYHNDKSILRFTL